MRKQTQKVSYGEFKAIAAAHPDREIETDDDFGLVFLDVGPIEYMSVVEGRLPS